MEGNYDIPDPLAESEVTSADYAGLSGGSAMYSGGNTSTVTYATYAGSSGGGGESHYDGFAGLIGSGAGDAEDYDVLPAVPTPTVHGAAAVATYPDGRPRLPTTSRPNARHVPAPNVSRQPAGQGQRRQGSGAQSSAAASLAFVGGHADPRVAAAAIPTELRGPKDQTYVRHTFTHGKLIYENFNPATGTRKTYEGGGKHGRFHGHGTWYKYNPPSPAPESGGICPCLGGSSGEMIETFDRYVGDFKAGRFHGEGAYTYAEGHHTYSGSWVDGLYNGHGTYVFTGAAGKPAESYVGLWQNGYYHGNGVFTSANGTEIEGTWVNGKISEEN